MVAQIGRICLVAVAIVVVTMAGSVLRAQDVTSISAEDRVAIRQVIQAQLDAFQRDDGVKAFSYAAPSIRRHFGTADRFMAMVKRGYAAVYRPREFEFLSSYISDRQIRQAVYFIGPQGNAFLGIYAMERQDDESWRIGGVILLQTGQKAI
ncbi:MAG: DUF4864 domain-containing protein [Alphaproteobacteria bacterium]|nr:DUF4864 domain-containing protein [Alphaproteobacteria bacterium]